MLTTLDMLYIILAFCAIWVTVFICWFLYQVIKVTRKFSDTLEEMREQVRHVEHAIHGVRVKFEDGAGYMKLISEYIKRLVTKFARSQMDKMDQ